MGGRPRVEVTGLDARRRPPPRRRHAARGETLEPASPSATGTRSSARSPPRSRARAWRSGAAARHAGARRVNAIWLLMGLLVLSYAGSFLVGGRAVRGGLPAGTEYVLLGFVLGPARSASSSDPCWRPSSRSRTPPSAGSRSSSASTTASTTGRRVGAARLLGVVGRRSSSPARSIAAAVWARCARGPGERARRAGSPPRRRRRGRGHRRDHAATPCAGWSSATGAAGPLTDLVGDLAESDDLAPLFVVAALFALQPRARPRGGAPAAVGLDRGHARPRRPPRRAWRRCSSAAPSASPRRGA